jgi:hypothetical protein
MPNEPTPKKIKKSALRLELSAPPAEMGNAISNVFGKLLGRSSEAEKLLSTPLVKESTEEATSAKMTEAVKMAAHAKTATAVILSEPPTPMAADAKMTPPAKTATAAKMTEVLSVPFKRGETSIPNFIWDGLLPLLDPTASLVYLRLYRLSYGFQSNNCTVGIGKLASSLNLGSRTVERAIAKLESVGLVKRLGSNFGKGVKGNTYLVQLPSTSGEFTSAKMTEAAISTEGVNLARAVILADNKDDEDKYIKENHHLNARAREEDDEDSDHFLFVKKLYEELTGNTWKQADTVAYQNVRHVSEEDIAEAMRQVRDRASSHPNTFKFFIREISATTAPVKEGREQQVNALLRIAREVRANNTGRFGYSESDFREDIKAAAARRSVRYTPNLIDEALERLTTNRR